MPALKEFANFINLNLANLAKTYARLLAENDEKYQAFPLDSRLASARRLLKAVTEACETQASEPLLRLFSGPNNGTSRRWAQGIDSPQPITEVESLGQTLTPVVTNLEAGKFLWQTLSQVRATVLQSVAGSPLPVVAPAKGEDDTGISARINEEIEKNYQSQAVLNQILQISLERVSLEEQLERMLDALLATPWLPALPKGGIFLVEDNTNLLILKAQRNLATPLLTMCARVPFGHCLCGRAAAGAEIQFADCVDHRHEIQYQDMAPHGHYNVPILLEEKVLGVIVLYLNEGHYRDEREITFLETVANTLAGLIRHKQMGEEMYERNEYLSALHETTLALMNRLNITDLLESIVARAAVLMDTPHGYISLVEPDQSATVTRVGIGNFDQSIGDRLEPGEGVAGKVWQTGQIVGIEDYQTLPNRVRSPHRDVLHAWIGVPLKSGPQVLGMIGLASSDEERLFKPDEIDLLTQFAELASVALYNAGLYAELQQELTERKHLERQIQASLARRVRQVQTSAEVAQEIAAAPALDDLFRQVVNLMQERFGYYYTHVYTLE